jgi:hypothetical protein
VCGSRIDGVCMVLVLACTNPAQAQPDGLVTSKSGSLCGARHVLYCQINVCLALLLYVSRRTRYDTLSVEYALRRHRLHPRLLSLPRFAFACLASDVIVSLLFDVSGICTILF